MPISNPIVLSIAGSDSGGGAGIQADIKTLSATGAYACTVVTALTAQNTLGVQGIHTVPPDFIRQQIDSVFSDLNVQAVKVGMLGDAATIECVAQAMKRYSPSTLVVDPVMVATSGDLLLAPEAVDTLKQQLLPLASLVTPNLYEAQVLLGDTGQPLPQSLQEMEVMAKRLGELNVEAVLLKGGHSGGDTSVDVFSRMNSCDFYAARRVDTQNTHGTGCTLSAAIASYCAQGYDLEQAVSKSKSYVSEALIYADQLQVGAGSGPLHHFYKLTR